MTLLIKVSEGITFNSTMPTVKNSARNKNTIDIER